MAKRVKVYQIKDVRLTRYRSDPPKLLIEVDGTVISSGYTAPELVEYVYVQPPPSGVYEFDFCATPPTGRSADVISSILVKHIVEPMPKSLKGVKVYASSNSQVELLGAEIRSATICIKGKLTDEGVECQAFRSTDGELYTLVGDLNGFQNGDEVVVCGTIAGISFCMQGITINVSWIGKEASRAQPRRTAAH
jgi:hypothetical protein